jgi:hypothetical protein
VYVGATCCVGTMVLVVSRGTNWDLFSLYAPLNLSEITGDGMAMGVQTQTEFGGNVCARAAVVPSYRKHRPGRSAALTAGRRDEERDRGLSRTTERRGLFLPVVEKAALVEKPVPGKGLVDHPKTVVNVFRFSTEEPPRSGGQGIDG